MWEWTNRKINNIVIRLVVFLSQIRSWECKQSFISYMKIDWLDKNSYIKKFTNKSSEIAEIKKKHLGRWREKPTKNDRAIKRKAVKSVSDIDKQSRCNGGALNNVLLLFHLFIVEFSFGRISCSFHFLQFGRYTFFALSTLTKYIISHISFCLADDTSSVHLLFRFAKCHQLQWKQCTHYFVCVFFIHWYDDKKHWHNNFAVVFFLHQCLFFQPT